MTNPLFKQFICRSRPTVDPISFAQPKEIGERKRCPLPLIPSPQRLIRGGLRNSAWQLTQAVSYCGLQTVRAAYP